MSDALAVHLTDACMIALPLTVQGFDAGGFKLWECAVDLANFLCQHFHIKRPPDAPSSHSSTPSLVGTSVLELGCGQGVPGILLGLCGAAVHFQVCISKSAACMPFG
jgi:hypothetical protein